MIKFKNFEVLNFLLLLQMMWKNAWYEDSGFLYKLSSAPNETYSNFREKTKTTLIHQYRYLCIVQSHSLTYWIIEYKQILTTLRSSLKMPTSFTQKTFIKTFCLFRIINHRFTTIIQLVYEHLQCKLVQCGWLIQQNK